MDIKEIKELGDFKILKKLGQGSLGTLFLAEHRFLRRPFAVKVLSPALSSDEGFVKRLEGEMGFWASLNHPNYVKIHNVSYAEGFYFIVMDYLGGADDGIYPLDLWMQNRFFSEIEILSLAKQLASLLDSIHHQTAHRSIKPSNLLIQLLPDQRLSLFATDGGLAKVLGEGRLLTLNSEALVKELSESAKIGTFFQNYHFLAPEQKNGQWELVDGKADAYSLGILIYLLLTGLYPQGRFAWPSELGKSSYPWDQLLDALLAQDPGKRPKLLTPLFDFEVKKERPHYDCVGLDQVGQILHERSDRQGAASSTPQPSVKPADRQGVQPVNFSPSYPAAKSNYQEESFATVSQPAIKPGYESTQLKPKINPSELVRPRFEEDPGQIFHNDHIVAPYKPKVASLSEAEPIQTQMAIVPAGEYMRGSQGGPRDEKPMHRVYVDGFGIDIHPVTNDQFVRFLESMGGEKDSQNNDMIAFKESRIKRLSGKFLIESGYGKHPVVGVTWYGALAYAKWVGKRLPTEAEWEIAAKGGYSDALFATGSSVERQQANFFSSDTTAVMSYYPNGYGLYDMAGNVYEWCHDWYDYNTYEQSQQEPTNPKGPVQGVYRVLRGGCWKSLKEDLRCAHRHRNNPGAANRTYGFRCAADLS